MGIALIIISFSTIFVDLGFGRAIIQQKEVTEVQLSTVFLLNLSISLFFSALLDTIFTRLDVFIIGKIFSSATLGFYTRAQSMDGVVRQISSTSIVSVLFPYLSKVQSDTEKVRELYHRYLHILSFVAFFLCGILYLTADSIFIILFTEKWIEAAILFKIITIAGFVYPISALMVSILSSRGNSVAYLKAEI
ncbi:MAG: oligosaccharide flippase family protein [Chitinophagaceae bacterium]|nr:oligosaccharide flippase family protein [Chitinophagaceae bacterium]